MTKFLKSRIHFFKDYPSMKSPEFSRWVSKTSAVEVKKSDLNRNLVQDKLLDEIEFKTRGFVLHSSGTGGKFSILVRDRIGSFGWAYALSKSGFFSVVPPSADANIVYWDRRKHTLLSVEWYSNCPGYSNLQIFTS